MSTIPARSGWTWGLALGVYWFSSVCQLHVEWSTNSQYNYGYAVPVLCALLFWLRWKDRPPADPGPAPTLAVLTAWVCAIVFLPTWLVQEANPEWRAVSWALALEAVGLTLAAIRITGGASRLKHFWFPVAFFLVAVPWPGRVGVLFIQALSRSNAVVAAELANALGVPALVHGNVIEVATGLVGIDDACSGIRSFQATLMISLFFGELYALATSRRALCVLAGFALSFAFNAARTTLLTFVAGRHGPPAIAAWHDPAGITIFVACFLSLWLLALWFKRVGRAVPSAPPSDSQLSAFSVSASSSSSSSFSSSPPQFLLSQFPLCLFAWFLLTVVLTELWYRTHGTAAVPTPAWSIDWQRNEPGFREVPLSDSERAMLRFNEGKCAEWRGAEGVRWKMFYFHWLPGRSWVRLASGHAPSACLPATGREVLSVTATAPIAINRVQLVFRVYHFSDEGVPAYVFYSLAEEGSGAPRLPSGTSTVRDRFATVWAGRRNPGQRVVEIAVWGINDPAEAQAAVVRQLEKLIVPN